MKINIHKANERGRSEIGWLSSRFSFSFADYFNPRRTSFGKLVVLNDDTIMPARGFGAHTHENMEIITLVMNGELEHKDSLGNIEVLKGGEMQAMSAGRGITHSEYNHSKTDKLELFQLWIETARREISPRHQTMKIELEDNKISQVVSGNKKDRVLFINQDSTISLGKFTQEKEIKHSLEKGKGLFLFVIEGEVEAEGKILLKRDSMEITDTSEIKIRAKPESYLMIIEVPLKDRYG